MLTVKLVDRTMLWVVVFAILILSFFSLSAVMNTFAETATAVNNKLVGAYYYAWYGLNYNSTAFNSNWENATSTPFWGEYVSNDSSIADTQIILAELHGIDFFAVSWLGDWNYYDHLAVNGFLQQGLLEAEHINTFKFCILYESKIILDSVYNDNESNDFFENHFADDMNYANATYFTNPSYLRIDGKPVVFIYDLPYLCQYLNTSVVHEMLVNLTQSFSNNIYLVGDVGSAPLPANVPFQLSIFSDVLNATTNYLFSGIPASVNSPTVGNFTEILNEAQQDYPQWQSNMTEEGMSFFPDVYPGYNDSKENASLPVLQANVTDFAEFLKIAFDNTGDGGITMITSWNEWKESTAIEPSAQMGDAILDVIPEFPSALVSSVILILTTLTVVVCAKWRRQRGGPHLC
jgi:hypothetical protein